MEKETRMFEQDFILVTRTELRVRQAMQYTHLDSPTRTNSNEETLDWGTCIPDSDPSSDGLWDECQVSLWECTLERL
jgi:hypothetical protein